MNDSTGRSFSKALIVLGLASVAARLAGLGRELVLADRFGTADVLDAYLVALMLPTFVGQVACWALGSALVPVLVRATLSEGRAVARGILLSTSRRTGWVLSALAVLLALAFPWIVPLLASGFAPAKLKLATDLALILLPLLVVESLMGAWASGLHAESRFLVAALVPATAPLAIVVVLISWPGSGIAGLVAATLVGTGLAAIVLRLSLPRVPTPPGPPPSVAPWMRQVGEQFWPVLSGALLVSGADLVDRSMAAMLAPGSVATLAYGGRIVGAVQGLGTAILGTALLPFLSWRLASGSLAESVAWARRRGARIALFALPPTLVLIFASQPLVRWIFQRGAFTAADTLEVARVQALFALQLPSYLLAILGIRWINALGANRVLLKLHALHLGANVIGNLALMPRFGIGGIALSTSLVNLLTTFLLFVALRRELRLRASAS